MDSKIKKEMKAKREMKAESKIFIFNGTSKFEYYTVDWTVERTKIYDWIG